MTLPNEGMGGAAVLLAWLAGILLVGGMVALAVAGTLLTRRRVGAEVLQFNNEVAGFIYAVVGVVYAVLLGLSAIIVWEQYDQAKVIVEREANELADLYRSAQTFPDGVRRELEARIRTYARLVVEKEWPAMAEHKASPEAWQAFNQLWRTYHLFRPENDHQRIWYAESLKRLNQLGDQRRLRLLNSRSEGVPGVMWVVLLGGGVVTVAYTFLFGSRGTAAQVLMAAGVAMMTALVQLSVLAMHHPFSGIVRVEPGAFDQTLEVFRSGGQTGADPLR